MRSAVVGGGLAGLAAALELAKARHDVTLYEARPTLGGAVQTLPEREGDPSPSPDNGQHIALGCCTEYLAFLGEIGEAGSVVRAPLSLPVIGPDGRVATIVPGALGLLRYGHLTLRDRLGVARVARALGKLDAGERDGETFAVLLRGLGQSQAAVDRFWDVFIRPALNIRSEEASAALGVFTVQTALLGDPGASDLILPRKPLGEMHGEAAGRALEAAGATIRTRSRVMSLEDIEADGVVLGATIRTRSRVMSLEDIEADGVVLAVPPAESTRLLGERDPGLEDSPIVSVHLLFDRRLLEFPLAALLGSPAHWVFDRGRLTGKEPEQGQYLTVVSSGTPELLEVRGRELVELMASELTSRLGPAELLWSRVSREPAATFAGRPGSATRRLGAETGRPNVVRAGAWTDTGWPATMESAVRSGRRAAALLTARLREKVPA